MATLSTCSWPAILSEATNIVHVQCYGRSPPNLCICNGPYVATWSTCSWPANSNFAQVEARICGDFVDGQSSPTSCMCNVLAGARTHHACSQTPRMCSVVGRARKHHSCALVDFLSTCNWAKALAAHAPLMWISARVMLSRFVHAVCTMRLSFMKYTIPGEEPRAPLPVP